MNIQELITALEKVENKDQKVIVGYGASDQTGLSYFRSETLVGIEFAGSTPRLKLESFEKVSDTASSSNWRG
jgi:hypothetical protein